MPDDAALRDLARISRGGNAPGLARQFAKLGGCLNPVRLEGTRLDVDGPTGEVLRAFSSHDTAAGCVLVRCGNRRTSRCPACAETYRRDTYHLISAGLAGGKSVPDTVTTHPRVFATFTAPSFGPVHNRPTNGHPCRCGLRHRTDEPTLGTPLDPDSYDYTAAVLWNAHAGKLWARFTTLLRRVIAAELGLTRKEFERSARVSFAKVAEFQKRGAVHFHAVIRIDGPNREMVDPPPAWATVELLDAAVRVAVLRTRVPGFENLAGGLPAHFVWGRQVDVRPIRTRAFDGGSPLTDRAVAAYIAKYATKGGEAVLGTLDRRIHLLAELAAHEMTDHARRLVRTAWKLGARSELADLGLRRWAHMLGFRGHFSTKSRRYSTTLGALRDARTAWCDAKNRAAAQAAGAFVPDPDTTLVVASWTYVGSGLGAGESWLARSATPDPATAREALADLRAQEGEAA
ncbi:replication initiation protein [Streptomyces sp. SID3343]|nr:replication initiation protein [Streptomyces sp. SID3343]